MCVWFVQGVQCLQTPEQHIRSPGAGPTGGLYQKQSSGPLQKQHIILTSDSYFI